jgi:hypothetical protein
MAFTLLDVFEEVDQVVYTFTSEDDLERWALTGAETFAEVRPATPDDVVSDDELARLMARRA